MTALFSDRLLDPPALDRLACEMPPNALPAYRRSLWACTVEDLWSNVVRLNLASTNRALGNPSVSTSAERPRLHNLDGKTGLHHR